MLAAAGALTTAWTLSTPTSAAADRAAAATPPSASEVTPPSIAKQVWGPQTPFTKARLCEGRQVERPDHPPLPPDGDPRTTPAAFSFDGQTNPDPSIKTDAADTSGAAGRDFYVQVVNFGFAIYSKNGELVCKGATADWWKDAQPTSPDQSPPPPGCRQFWTDAVVLYDQLAGRWFESRFTPTETGWDQCVAVSMTDNPTGGWFLYAVPTTQVAGEVNLAPCPNPNGPGFIGCASDYPKWGIWPNGYYLAAFARPQTSSGLGTPVGVIMEGVDRRSMLAGAPANAVSFSIEDRGEEQWLMQPAGLDGQAQPSFDAPGLFAQVQSRQIGFDLPADQGRLVLWELHVPVAGNGTWENDITGSSFSQSQAITPQPNFDPVVCSSQIGQTGICIEQPSRVRFDALDHGFPMYRTAFRRLADHDTLLFNFTVGVPGPPPDGKIAGVRWIEFQQSGNGPWSIHQQGDFAPGADARVSHWLGSLANDHNGDMALGYSETAPGTDQHPPIDPSIGYVGRAVDDPVGTLRTPLTLQQGHDSQRDDDNQFGDYSQMTIDPVDDCTFWYTNEYYKHNMGPEHLWSTRIGAFRFPACGAAPPVPVAPTFTG